MTHQDREAARDQPVSADRRCGTCKHYRAHSQMLGAGQCWCNPPQMIPASQAGVAGLMPVRPVVQYGEQACGQWTPPTDGKSKPAPSAAQVKSKLGAKPG